MTMTRLAPALVFALALTGFHHCVLAQATPASDSGVARQARVRAYLEEQRERRGFPGVGVGWVMPGGHCEAVAVGFSDVQLKRRMTVRDRMLSGSIGKTYVVTVALQLVEEKRLGLADLVSEHLSDRPWFKQLPNAATLTIRSLMNHTSGIKRYVFGDAFCKVVRTEIDKVWKPTELLSYVFGADPLFPVGEGWAYADTNYIVLGLVLEQVTGVPFYRSLQRRVLHRFDLKDTLPSDRRNLPGLAQGYSAMGADFGVVDKTLKDGVFVINPQFEWCGGGLYSTPADLARWAAIFGAGRHWSKELLAQIRQGVDAPMLGRGAKYGLGTMVTKNRHGQSFGHSGFMPGYRSEMRYYPKLDFAIAIQFNTDNPRRLGQRPGSYLDAIIDVLGVVDRK